MVLRPEAITVLEPNGAPPERVLAGTVRRSAFLGPVVEYEVALDGPGGDGLAESTDTTEMTVAVHDRNPDRLEPLPEGSAVWLRPLQRELYFLPAGGAAGGAAAG